MFQFSPEDRVVDIHTDEVGVVIETKDVESIFGTVDQWLKIGEGWYPAFNYAPAISIEPIGAMDSTATEKQVSYLRNLISRVVGEEDFYMDRQPIGKEGLLAESVRLWLAELVPGYLSKAQASRLIEALKSADPQVIGLRERVSPAYKNIMKLLIGSLEQPFFKAGWL